MVCLLISAAIAAWSWFRPYAWQPDPAARCKVVETLVTRDHSYYWVDVHLKVDPGKVHDLQKPVYLETAPGKRFEPADTTFGGRTGQPPAEIWLKFWVEAGDLAHPLNLHLNDGNLVVKATQGTPHLGAASYRNFTTNHW